MISAEDKDILAQYSAGTLGWRAACHGLRLLDIGELHALLEAEKLPAPQANTSPPDAEQMARFRAVLGGEQP